MIRTGKGIKANPIRTRTVQYMVCQCGSEASGHIENTFNVLISKVTVWTSCGRCGHDIVYEGPNESELRVSQVKTNILYGQPGTKEFKAESLFEPERKRKVKPKSKKRLTRRTK